MCVMPVVLSAGAGAPRDFMAPSTCGGLSCQASPEPASARLPALTWNYVKVLPSASLLPRALPGAVINTSTAGPSEPRNGSGPCLTLGLLRLRFRRSLLSTRGTLADSAGISSCLDRDFLGGSSDFPQRIDGCPDRWQRPGGRVRPASTASIGAARGRPVGPGLGPPEPTAVKPGRGRSVFVFACPPARVRRPRLAGRQRMVRQRSLVRVAGRQQADKLRYRRIRRHRPGGERQRR